MSWKRLSLCLIDVKMEEDEVRNGQYEECDVGKRSPEIRKEEKLRSQDNTDTTQDLSE